MKKFIFYFSICIVIVTAQSELKANPVYKLTAIDFALNCGEYDTLEWDIYLKNFSNETMYYANGKFVFNFTPSIANGGDLFFEIVSTDLPLAVRPVDLSISDSTLTINGNTAATPGEALIINPFGEIKIARVRLITSATTFSGNSFYPTWKDTLPSEYTKVYAFVGTTFSQINSHSREVRNTYCQMFSESPWECCFAKLLSLDLAIEGQYDPALNRLNKEDTVTVELRDITYPHILRASSKATIDSVNLSSFLVYTIQLGIFPPCYIVIRHRNSIETWSKTTIFFWNGGYVNQYNTTLSDTSAYGNNLKLKGTKYCIYSGDVNQDKAVNLSDILLVYNDSRNFVTGYVDSDLNGDNIVNLSDISIVSNNSALFVRAITPLD